MSLPLQPRAPRPDGWADALICKVGLADRLAPALGALRRPAAARGDRPGPRLEADGLFADEPTGNLDSTTSGEILDLLQDSVATYGQTTVMVTHDAHAAAIADRVLFLADGLIVKDLESSPAPTSSRRWKR